MLTQVHFLLTYACNYECDHCFLYCSPRAEGTFTITQINTVLDDLKRAGTVEWVYFEGGEPFIYYPIMVAGLKAAAERGFKTGIVTNTYWATSPDDALLWLQPIADNGIDMLSVSDDVFHFGDDGERPAVIAVEAAEALGISVLSICIEKPTVQGPASVKGEPVVEGGALFKGRAADKLTGGLPTRPPDQFRACPYEELVEPKRVHVDAFGNIMVCQGISIGNLWRKPLSETMNDFKAHAHPICGPLSDGGPAELAATHRVHVDGAFVDECHYCFAIRRKLLDVFPEYLTPLQVYGGLSQ